MRAAGVASLGFVVLACACTQQFAQGPTMAEQHAAILPVPADRARIYIYRPYNYIGSAGTPYVQIDHWMMGEAPLNGVLYCDVAPGNHEIWSMDYLNNRQKMLQSFSVAPGGAAYFRVAPNFSTGFDFAPVPEPTGAQETSSLHLVAAHCEGSAPATAAPTVGGAQPVASNAQKQAIAQAMAKGAAAEQSGDLKGALSIYTETLQKYATTEVGPVSEVIGRAIDVALKINPRPNVPAEASRHAEAAVAKIKASKTREDLDVARLEMMSALAIAPWWADGWFNLAAVDENLGAFAAAASDLGYYLHAAPNAPDAASIRKKIDDLQSKAH